MTTTVRQPITRRHPPAVSVFACYDSGEETQALAESEHKLPTTESTSPDVPDRMRDMQWPRTQSVPRTHST